MYECGTLRLIMSKCKICKTCGSEYSELNFKKYCSRKCYEIRPGGFVSGGSEILQCLHCNKDVLKFKSEIRKNPDKVFCNNSCASFYNKRPDNRKTYFCKFCNKPSLKFESDIHSKNIFFFFFFTSKYYSQFTKRKEKSNLEIFILQKLIENFPYLYVLCSDREQCSGLELDFYFPDLNLAIEVNGPIHYDPIYGETYLQNIQERDNRKSKICENKNIELRTIKNYERFSEKIGYIKWMVEIRPILLEKIPFCEPSKELETNLKLD